jgi:hypothetical protein
MSKRESPENPEPEELSKRVEHSDEEQPLQPRRPFVLRPERRRERQARAEAVEVDLTAPNSVDFQYDETLEVQVVGVQQTVRRVVPPPEVFCVDEVEEEPSCAYRIPEGLSMFRANSDVGGFDPYSGDVFAPSGFDPDSAVPFESGFDPESAVPFDDSFARDEDGNSGLIGPDDESDEEL